MPTNGKILSLKLSNFRNIEENVIEFSEKINCIFGENGNGKTNILEAIYYLSNKKSFRKKASFPQILSIDSEKPEIIISTLARLDKEKKTFSMKINLNSTIMSLNGTQVKSRPSLKSVFINPFDSYVFHTSSSFRRSWFDNHMSVLDIEFKKNLKKYNTSLKFRNTLLAKKPNSFLDQIKVIDIELSKYSKIIINKRVKFLNDLSEYTSGIFKQIFSEVHNLKITLDSKFIGYTERQIYDVFQQNLEKDLIIGYTKYGIHVDDFIALFDDLNSFDYCSLGQQKMSYLSLLFAYIELFRYNYVSYPLVLIDDVSGELDCIRWQNLIDYLIKSNFQVFITTANELFRHELDKIDDANKFLVTSGTIKKI